MPQCRLQLLRVVNNYCNHTILGNQTTNCAAVTDYSYFDCNEMMLVQIQPIRKNGSLTGKAYTVVDLILCTGVCNDCQIHQFGNLFYSKGGRTMSKFNKTNTIKTVNRSGYEAYAMKEKEQLVTAVLTTFFGEPKFYGSTDNDIVRLAVKCAENDPLFLCKLACYARNDGNLRSVSHVLAAVIAHEAREYTRAVIRNTVIRPDDITEIMSCYEAMYGKPFPNAMKREIALVIQKFDEYQLAKYNGGNKALKLRDVVRITHPVPKDKEEEALLGKLLRDELETPYTWETELSARGNSKEVWNELINSGRVPYMALLRNLRNIAKSGAEIGPALEVISDPERVRKSRQLPFRFYSAYRELINGGYLSPEIHRALERAIDCSTENVEKLKGRTLIALDRSGSMGRRISEKSEIHCCDIASLIAVIASRICEDADVCFFDTSYRITHYGRYDSILDTAVRNSFAGGGTDLSLPMKYALLEDRGVDLHPFDRVIYISDNECNTRSWYSTGLSKSIQGLVDDYRRKYNPDFWVHGIDLQGYGTQQFCGKNFNLIAGWSDKVLSFIPLAEAGISTLVDTIEAYEIK